MDAIPKNHAGTVIADRLEKLGRTQTWLAHEAKVSNNAVTKWIRTGQITRTNAIRVAEILGVSTSDLLLADLAPEPRLNRLLQESETKEAEAPTVLIHVTPSELELLNTYRKATMKSRLMIEVVAMNAELDPSKGRAPDDK